MTYYHITRGIMHASMPYVCVSCDSINMNNINKFRFTIKSDIQGMQIKHKQHILSKPYVRYQSVILREWCRIIGFVRCLGQEVKYRFSYTIIYTLCTLGASQHGFHFVFFEHLKHDLTLVLVDRFSRMTNVIFCKKTKCLTCSTPLLQRGGRLTQCS